MSVADGRLDLVTPEQREAMGHPTRHRITLALGEPKTVSELARELRINKGNVAHHVAVLERVRLITRAGTRTGRGGTGVLYRSFPLHLSGRTATEGMMSTITDSLLADPDALAYLRTVRLTAAQARALAEHLEKLVEGIPAQAGARRYGVFVSCFKV